MSYHVSTDETVRNAAQLIGGATAVKLEGGHKRVSIQAILDADPGDGALGLTQSVHKFGGFKVQGKPSKPPG
jgi:ketopantoate hydroxymethyltransferase